ncbi:hypothetical protein ACHRVW_03250 [Flavobacterium collinsii]|uniref:hypothetical protein n=1 Tax=Flavobacterium collinsii TaxID=1114861 RepID=UPI003756C6E6
MATKNISSDVETRLKDFFKDFIEPKDMARMLRQVNYVLSVSSMRGCEAIETELSSIDDNFYWLNKLAEVLDPYLDVR